jgi:hypothetical protein
MTQGEEATCMFPNVKPIDKNVMLGTVTPTPAGDKG